MTAIPTTETCEPSGAPLGLASTPDGESLVVAVAGKANGKTRILAMEAVNENDLTAARDETWWRGVRTGRLPPALGDLTMKLIPGSRHRGGLVDGYSLELGDASHRYGHRFTVHSLSRTAQRALGRLIHRKQLPEDAEVSYHLVCQPVKPPRAGASDQPGPVHATLRHAPLLLGEASLDEYIESSQPVSAGQATEPGDHGELPPMPVFFHPQVWAKGHSLARRGNDLESAGVWTGRLMRDTNSPEVFLVVDACIDAKHAAEEKYSVTFTGETWRRVRQVLDQRRRRLNRPQEIILGSVHGHNFAPGTKEEGGRLCDECPQLATCRSTTAVLSAADLKWHQSVFSAQPYAIMALWGWSARNEEVWQCYSLDRATLVSRPLRILTTGS